MMEILRAALKEAIPGHPIEPQNWWGPGAIAQALLKSYLGKEARAILGDINNDSEPLRWVRSAFFGARIEPPMGGRTKKKLWEYDITSAYPAFQVGLPSMKGGNWVYKENPTREDIEQSCALSILEIHTSGCNPNLPLYPLPWRCRGRFRSEVQPRRQHRFLDESLRMVPRSRHLSVGFHHLIASPALAERPDR